MVIECNEGPVDVFCITECFLAIRVSDNEEVSGTVFEYCSD